MKFNSVSVILSLIMFLILPVVLPGWSSNTTVVVEEESYSGEGLFLVPPEEASWIRIAGKDAFPEDGDRSPLPVICREAVNSVPGWLKNDLTHKFRELPSGDAEDLAGLIVNSPEERYTDEIGFTIAHSTVSSLTDDDFFPELLTQNAALIYERDVDLDYVEIVELNDHTTLEMVIEGGEKVLLPRDLYYWYVAHPRIGDELPTYVDPDYNYVTDPPFSRDHGVAPPTGKYWRDWLYGHNKSGQPLLKDELTGAENVMDAIRSVNGWISNSLEFTSDQERPNQPVRIYQKGIGRCGEYQDMRAAAARIGLIPVICTNNPAEDHVWNEFWMDRWIHWDGSIDRPHMYEEGWGKTLSAVWNGRGDGYIWSVTGRYSGSCNITVNVTDSSEMPVEGAKVEILTENFYQEDMRTVTIWGVTDQNGSITMEVGEGRNYWYRVDGGDLGRYPPQISGTDEVATDYHEGEEYLVKVELPKSSPEPRANRKMDSSGEEMRLIIDFIVDSYITTQGSSYTGGSFDRTGKNGSVDYLLLDENNFNAYRTGLPFTYLEYRNRVGNVSQIIPRGDEENLYVVFSNEYSQFCTKVIRYDISLVNHTGINVSIPLKNAIHPLGEDLLVNGTAISPTGFDSIMVSLEGSQKWESTDEFVGPDNQWSCKLPEDQFSPGPTNLVVRGDDGVRKLEVVIPITIEDTQGPEIELISPSNGSSLRRGVEMEIAGSVEDLDRVEFISVSVDGREEVYDYISKPGKNEFRFELGTGYLDIGFHDLSLSSGDPAGNVFEIERVFEILEDQPPELRIDHPEEGSLISSSDPIEISGIILDNTGVTSLSMSVDGGRMKDIGDSISGSSFVYYWDASGYTDGEHTINLQAKDSAGNSAETDLKLSIDGTGPILNVLNEKDIRIVAGGDSPTLEMEVLDSSGVELIEYYLDRVLAGDITRRLSGRRLEADLEELSYLGGGEYEVVIRAVDGVGNPSEKAIDLYLDDKPPECGFSEHPPIFEIGEDIEVFGFIRDDLGISGARVELESGGMEELNVSTEEFSITLGTSSVNAGERRLSLICTDLAGNEAIIRETIRAVTSRTDSDRDGIPDLVEIMYDGMDPLVYDSDLDLDGDGYSNIQEYLGDDRAHGGDDSTDPMDPSSFPVYEEKGEDIPILPMIIGTAAITIIMLIFAAGWFFIYKRPS